MIKTLLGMLRDIVHQQRRQADALERIAHIMEEESAHLPLSLVRRGKDAV